MSEDLPPDPSNEQGLMILADQLVQVRELALGQRRALIDAGVHADIADAQAGRVLEALTRIQVALWSKALGL